MSDIDIQALAPTIQSLSDADKQEVGQTLARTQQQQNVSETIHNLSMTCFTKCITGKISADTLSGTERSCAQNCVQRWMDVQERIVKDLSAGFAQKSEAAESKGFFG